MAEKCGTYRLEDRLNVGGMAEVFHATSSQDRHVIIRRLRHEFQYSWSKRRDFIRGLRIQAGIEHPNVVRVFELVTLTLQPYAVMEFVGGMNLRQAMIRKDPLLRAPLPIFHQILNGFIHIHGCGYLHLDVKPENMLVQPDGHTRIADFDLAQPILKVARKQPLVQGTPAYLAPEQILKLPIDARTDIFAFGLTAFELFTGRKPVARTQREEIFAAYTDMDTPFPSPRSFNPTIPESLETILGTCLEKNPDRRYNSFRKVLQDVEESGVMNDPGAITQPDAEDSWSSPNS